MAILRWILVLPAAVLAHAAVQFIVGTMLRIAIGLAGMAVRQSPFAYWLQALIYYVVSELVFVVAGAKIAPRHQSATAVTLAILGSLLSLIKHTIGQHLGGNRVGVTNYLHLGLEVAGLLAGAAFILVTERTRRLGDKAPAATGSPVE